MRWRTHATCARSFICPQSASTATMAANGSTRPRRRSPARRAAARGSMPRAPGSDSARAAAPRSSSCASPASTDPDRMLWSRSNRETRAGSSSPARSSTASTSPISRRRSTRRLPARAAASSTSPTTSQVRPAIRSPSRRNCSAAIHRRKYHSKKPRTSLSPMALSFWQECRRVRNDRLKRELGVSLLYPTYREGLRALFAAR